jgi:hypothetical protein
VHKSERINAGWLKTGFQHFRKNCRNWKTLRTGIPDRDDRKVGTGRNPGERAGETLIISQPE